MLLPALRAVENSQDVHNIVCDLIDHDIRQFRNHQFARSWFPAWRPRFG